jgi:FG-GAP-like repeat
MRWTAIRMSILTLTLWDCAGDSSAAGPAPEPTPGVPVAYSTGGTMLTSLAATNLVGDDHPDLIAVARGDGSIRVLPGQPGGGFGAALSFIAGDDPVQAAAGDVNGDGRPDLVVIGHLSNALYLSLGLGGNGLGPPVKYALRNHGNNFVIADLNHDGLADVVVSHDGSGAPIYVTAFLGSASGKLQQVWELGTDYFTTEGVAAGDFDADGQIDVAVATSDPRAAVLVFHGLGTGEFSAPSALPPLPAQPQVSDGTSAVSVGDLNGDGRDDIVTAAFQLSNQLVIRLSSGSGFAEPVPLPLPAPVDVQLSDLNGDGKLDAVASNLGQSVSLLSGAGNGTFEAPVGLSMGPEPVSLAVADFDGDGRADIAVADLRDNAIRVRLSPR